MLPESEILALVEALQQEGALVNWKNNPDSTRSPYEMNVTYMDALSRRESSDEERCARFILAHAILLSFPGVPAIYIQSILGSRNDYAGVEKLGYNRAINRKKYHSKEITRELNDEATLRHAVYHELSRLIKIRRSHNEFHPDNDFTIDTVNSSVMCIQRSNADGNCLTGLFNFSENIQHINITDLHGRDLISEVDIVGNEITLRPWQVMWIK